MTESIRRAWCVETHPTRLNFEVARGELLRFGQETLKVRLSYQDNSVGQEGAPELAPNSRGEAFPGILSLRITLVRESDSQLNYRT